MKTNKKYIHTYTEYKNISEGIFSKLFNKAKDKLSLSISKKLGGSANKVDKIMATYKNDINVINTDVNSRLKTIMDLEAANIDGKDTENNKTKLEKAINDFKKINKLADKKKLILKEKFNLEFNKITKEVGNDEIKHYIQLMKIKMSEELIQDEISMIEKEFGDKIESSDIISKIVNGKKTEFEELEKSKKIISDESEKTKSSDKGNKSKYVVDDKVIYVKKDGEAAENPGIIKSIDMDNDIIEIEHGNEGKITKKTLAEIVSKVKSEK